MAFRLGENILPHLQNRGSDGDETTLSSTQIETNISTEKARAELAEEALQNKFNDVNTGLDAEIERAKKAESDETTRAKAIEKSLTDDLTQEISDRKEAIKTETEEREDADSTLTTNLNAEISRAKKAEADEKSAREEAISTLTGIVDAETSAREDAIKQEVEDRNRAIADALDSLDSEDSEVAGQFVSKVVGENGTIKITRKEFSNKVTKGDVNAPSGDAVYQALQTLGTLYTLKGSVDDYDSLPAEVEAGWVYNAKDTGDNYVWTGTEWDKLGGTSFVDALNFANPKSEGQAVQFIDSISQTNGQITATKKEIPTALTSRYGVVKIAESINSTEMSAAHPSLVKNYVDGEIDNEVSNRDAAISAAISTEVSNRNKAIENAVNALNVEDTPVEGQYVSAISEEGGLISITRKKLPTLSIADSVTLGGVKSLKTGTTEDRDYNVQVNADGTMKVNVPWVDTDNDTKNTAGSTNTTDKLYLVGASAQKESDQTYTNSQVYEQNGNLYAANTEGTGTSKVVTEDSLSKIFKYDPETGILTIEF